MIVRTPSERPVIFAIRLRNWEVVDRCESCGHQPVVIELPVLVAIRAVPVTRIIMPLVGESDCDTVPGERPQFLDEPVVELLRPFARQETNDFDSSIDELRAIPPS